MLKSVVKTIQMVSIKALKVAGIVTAMLKITAVRESELKNSTRPLYDSV